MRRALGRREERRTRSFERLVARELEAPDRVVRTRAKKFDTPSGRVRMPSNLGDIDVLAYSRSNQRLIVIECKAMGASLTPAELANELTTLFVDSGNRLCIQTRHRNRVKWVSDNLDSVLASLGAPPGVRPDVTGLIVTGEELPGAYLRKAELPTESVHAITRELRSDRLVGRRF